MHDVLAAFEAESAALSDAMSTVDDAGWARPSPCPPWSVAGLFGHVIVTVDRVPGMLRADAPPAATVDATGYYRPGERFSAATNATRIAVGEDRAALPGPSLVTEFTTISGYVVRLCRQESAGRVVRTRHGDAMTLTDFMLTRVVEVAVHGIDLAAALDRPAWTTPEAASAVSGLLLGGDGPAPLGWDRLTFLRKATGRARMTEGERDAVARGGIRWLALG
ncbi:maleylpyruvate isomerase family mycothiol-dependent enzyme [Catenuloplanes japonicus]|uniref:maleylpyruvate isomerase family mycothiol-dependent enzyme n=1 Tax=Catenuloplanes japonicus TaxID=33876 RepID=UPI0005278DDA|nr:maleylpyruvate isomerase family mycothiol-dependent enzyme [Catenuloplanes japonicus]